MRPSNKNIVAVFALSFSLLALITSCGIDKKPHFGDKTFGQTDAQSGGDLPIADEPSEPNPSQPVPPVESEPEEPTDQVLSYFGFGGYFNLNTVRRIFRGSDKVSAEISQGGFLDNVLSRLLGFVIGDGSRESLSMMVQQNGRGRNRVTQQAETGGGDNIANFKGGDSQSGTQIIDWALTGSAKAIACPTPFVCVERMVWIPNSGETMTYCYRDHETKKPIVIPYSPNSHFGGDAFAAAIGEGLHSTPIEVVTHPGDVACDAEGIETRDVKLVVYDITMGNLADQRSDGFLRRAIHRGLPADTEIVVQFSLYSPEHKQPFLPKTGIFIDQLTRLNSKMRFFLNSQEHVMVKIERTVQSPLKLEGSTVADTIREMYGDTAAYLADLLFPRDGDTVGAQLVYSFEFCTHLGVIRNPFNHCTGSWGEP